MVVQWLPGENCHLMSLNLLALSIFHFASSPHVSWAFLLQSKNKWTNEVARTVCVLTLWLPGVPFRVFPEQGSLCGLSGRKDYLCSWAHKWKHCCFKEKRSKYREWDLYFANEWPSKRKQKSVILNCTTIHYGVQAVYQYSSFFFPHKLPSAFS